jgi:acyl-CoA thioesterase-2
MARGWEHLPVTHVPSISRRIALEQVERLRFRGGVHETPLARTYGGEVAGQAVLAAGSTVDPARHIHSAHMHFLLPGDPKVPVELEVDEVRDGGSFTTRRVEAIQRDRVIFTMTASFQTPEVGLEHQLPTMTAPPPDTLPPADEMFAGDPDNLLWFGWLSDAADIEARFPELPARAAASRGVKAPPQQRVWLRARQPIDHGDLARAAALAFVSDLLLLSAALGPHQLTFQGGQLQFATVNHTVWFHAPLAIDDWFLYDQRSPWAAGGRALCTGEIYDPTGRLCATIMQEGLLRVQA